MIRNRQGITITELAVSTILIGFSLAVIGELVVLNTFASTKLTNKIDGQVGCSRAIRRISEDIRQGRAIGNIYSLTARNSFPDNSASSNDPFVMPPPEGFPTSPWPAIPYKLGPQTLIIQQPVYFDDPNNLNNPKNGFPLRLATGSITASPPVPSYPMEYVDTIVYQLIPDSEPNTQGQFILQIARFSGRPAVTGTKLRQPLNPPQTVLKGIVGPMDPSNPGVPVVFQYLRSPKEQTPLSAPDPGETMGLTGVSINFEVKMPNSNVGANQEIAGGHAEAYLKNGRFVRLIND